MLTRKKIVFRPARKPKNMKFSTGPVAKHPDYQLYKLSSKLLGRSHRSADASLLLKEVVDLTRKILQIPESHHIILTPGSATGAMEIALWNLIGEKPVDCLLWDHFSSMWAEDLEDQLKVKKLNLFKANYGEFPNISSVDFLNNDVVFTYCGTTSGVVFNQEKLIPENRKGLTHQKEKSQN